MLLRVLNLKTPFMNESANTGDILISKVWSRSSFTLHVSCAVSRVNSLIGQKVASRRVCDIRLLNIMILNNSENLDNTELCS